MTLQRQSKAGFRRQTIHEPIGLTQINKTTPVDSDAELFGRS